MNKSQQVRIFRAQVGLSDVLAIPLKFAPAYGEDGYRIPEGIGVERDPKSENALVLTWLDVARMNGWTSGRQGPPTADCLFEFVSLGKDGRWEKLGRQSGRNANTPDREVLREHAFKAEENAALEVRQFARKHGPLAIWPYQDSFAPKERAYRLREPVHYYWRLARRMRTALLLAQHLRNSNFDRPKAADIRELLGENPGQTDEAIMGNLGKIVSEWMRGAQVHSALTVNPARRCWQPEQHLPNWVEGLDWDERIERERNSGTEHLEPNRRYKSLGFLRRGGQRPSSVFAILVMQMVAALSSEQGVIQCQFCLRLFHPLRKPRTDGDYIRTCDHQECKRRAHNFNQNASNLRKREKRKNDETTAE